jgi:hypothetical protein
MGVSQNGVSNTANAHAAAQTAAGQQAMALATAKGDGTATTVAGTAGGIFSNVAGTATGQASTTVISLAIPAATTQSISNIAGDVAGLDHSGLNSYAFTTALPDSSFVSNAFATHPVVGSAFNAAGASVLGTAAQGAFYASDATGSLIYDSQAKFTFDTSHLSGDLLVGLLDHASFGAGFDSLTFSIAEQGLTVFNTAFTTFAAAEAFFDDRVLDLGSSTVGPNLDLLFDFDLIASKGGNGFGEDFLLGAASSAAVPEPSTLSLLGLAALMTIALRHSRRGARDDRWREQLNRERLGLSPRDSQTDHGPNGSVFRKSSESCRQ